MTTLQLSRDGTRPLGQLSRHLMVHPTTVTLALDQLEKRNLVKRSPHPTDRRTILAVLTPAGQEMLEVATKALADADFGLPASTARCPGRVVEVLGEVRQRIGDIRALAGGGGFSRSAVRGRHAKRPGPWFAAVWSRRRIGSRLWFSLWFIAVTWRFAACVSESAHS